MKKSSLNPGTTVFALDIGTKSVIGLLGTWENDKLVIHHTAMEFHKKRTMYDGQIHDIEGVVEIVKRIKAQLEERAGFSLQEVAVAAAGRALKTCRVKIEREIDNNIEIDKHLINSMEIEGLQKAQSQLESQSSEITNYLCVGHTVVNYYLNDGLITNPLGHRGRTLGADILATFLPEIVVDSLNAVMYKVGLNISYLTLEPIAAIEVAVPQNIRLLNIALVDIGAGTSDIAVTKDGTIIAYAMTSIAGDEITEALAKAYLLDFDTAERLKCNLCNDDLQQFTDIFGVQHEVRTVDILEQIKPAIEMVAKEIVEQILLQNKKAPSAIFLIGGGSQIPHMDEMISTMLHMPKERVVVRGIEIIQNLHYENLQFTGPEGITPIGILAKAIQNKENDFIEVEVNGKRIQLIQTKKLRVSDALVLTGFNPRDLIPKRSSSVSVFINGYKKTFYGEYGEPAKIFVNYTEASLDTAIKNGDSIFIETAKPGKKRVYHLKDIVNLYEFFDVNGKKLNKIYNVRINDKIVDEKVIIQDDDRIEYEAINTVKDLSNYLKMDSSLFDFIVNGHLTDLDQFIQAGDQIKITKKVEKKEKEREKISKERIIIYYNGNPLMIEKGEEDLIFVDIFNYIDFDRSSAKGKLILKHNGRYANYTDLLRDGDEIEIYWEK